MSSISEKSEKTIEKFVNYISLKLGYVPKENMTYLEQMKLELQNSKSEITESMRNFRQELEDFTQKLKVSSSENDDFKEEMKQFLLDSVEEKMSQGYSEDEALKRALEQFGDEQSLEFKDHSNVKGWEAMEGQEAIGLFYAAGLFLGTTGGAIIGFITGHLFFGAAAGAAAGIGLGLLSHGLVALKQGKA